METTLLRVQNALSSFGYYPIKIDVEDEGVLKARDTILWNMQEQVLTPQTFAEWYCEDVGIAAHLYQDVIAKEIISQIAQFENIVQQLANALDETPLPSATITIKLDVRLQDSRLNDQFEWELCFDSEAQEQMQELGTTITLCQFAQHLCKELQIASKYVAIVTHSVYEEAWSCLQRLKLNASDDAGGKWQREPEEWEIWAPKLQQLTENEKEALAKREERDARSRRRRHAV